MKKYFFVAVIWLTAAHSNAQITISSSDFAAQLAVGHHITSYANFSIKSADIGSPGPASWNFSGLISEAQFVTESRIKSSSTYSNDFPDAQYASYYEGTFSGVFSQTWVYDSIGPDFNLDGTGTFTSPAGMNSTTFVSYSPKRKQYQLPMTVNSAWNSSGTQTVKTTMTVPVIGDQTTTIVQNYSSSDTVDAYGPVTMPGGKILSALRIKTLGSLTTNSQTSAYVIYIILTKTGESVSITAKEGSPVSGLIDITAISWTSGDGIGNPSGVEESGEAPAFFSLAQNYPNPFNPTTKIRYEIPGSGIVSMRVSDVFGRIVAEPVYGFQSAGSHDVEFNASNLSSGIYFYRLETGNFISTKKMVFMK
jgi:hypothetical protein